MEGTDGLFTILRMRQRASLFIGLFMVGAIITGVCAGVVGFLSSSATTGVRGALAATPATDLSLGITMPLAPDAAEQARVTAQTLRNVFHDGARAIPISIESTVQSVIALEDPGADSGAATRRAGVATASHLDSDAQIAAGRWGSDPGEATLQADAAAALGVVPGDTLSIEGREVTVVGTWRLADANDARWMADELWTTGADGSTVGPIIIDPSLWSTLNAEPWVNWTIIPDAGRLQATDLAAIDEAWDETSAALKAAGLQTGVRSGRFLASAGELGTRLAALQTAIPLALVTLAAIAALTLWELAGLTTRTRATETALLWSRGATTASLSARAGAEAAVVTAIGSAVGVSVAALLQWNAGGTDAAASALASGWWAAAAVIAVTALAFAVRTARTAGPARSADRAGRARRFAGAGGVVLLVIAAGLSTWQLLTYGPITGTGIGGTSVDPITVVAPALILASGVLLGLYAFPLLAGAAERTATRTTGMALAVRGVSRRIGAAAAAIVMIGLAAGQLIVAAGYSATWSAAFTQTQELEAGTALRLAADFDGVAEADLDRAAAATDVVGLAPVHVVSFSIGGDRASLVGVAPAAIADLMADGRGLVDPVAVSVAIPSPSAAILPDGATTVSVDVGSSPAIAESVWLTDAWGRLEKLTLTPSTPGVATAVLPSEGRTPWRLAAIDLAPTGDDAAATTDESLIAVESVTTDAGAVSPVPSTLAAFRDGGALMSRAEIAAKGLLRGSGAVLRLLPAAGVSPIAISETLAERIGAEIGSSIAITVPPATIPLQTVVAAITPAIPGSNDPSAVMIDGSVIDAEALRTAVGPEPAATVWVGSTRASESAESLRALLPASVRVRELGAEPDLPMLAAGAKALWLAAGAGSVLAIAGLIAVCAGQQRERRHEIAVLRAVGLSSGQQGGVRRGELALITGWGAICGVAAGTVTLLVVVATLARAAIPGAYPNILTPVQWDPVTGATALGALLIAVTVVIAIAGVLTERSARSLTLQEAEG
ncbi:FtsX-like permease family protein [Microbacterium sp. P5_E9]